MQHKVIMPKNIFNNIHEIEQFLEEKVGLKNIPENILDDIRLTFKGNQVSIFGLDKILEYSNFFRPFNISINTFAGFFNQNGSSWRSKLTRGGWEWDKEKNIYFLNEKKVDKSKKLDQSDVLTNVNLSNTSESESEKSSYLSPEEVTQEIKNIKQKITELNKFFKIINKENNYFEISHLDDFQKVIIPQRGESLIMPEQLEGIRVREVCAQLFRKAIQKIGNTRKNIVSELYYRFALSVLSEEEIAEVLYEEFGIEELE